MRILLCLLAVYPTIVLIGLIPVNNDFRPAREGVEIFLVSSLVHADIVMPVETPAVDWRTVFPPDCFAGDTSAATHIAVGWGDRAFFVETPEWADVRPVTVAKALSWPSDSCLHVTYTQPPALSPDARAVVLSTEQYERLARYVQDSRKRGLDAGSAVLAGAAYGERDAFFRAEGSYHCLNTCNCWVGGAMKAGGIRTGWFTPLPRTMFLYLPDECESQTRIACPALGIMGSHREKPATPIGDAL